jgi:hypothetical protein
MDTRAARQLVLISSIFFPSTGFLDPRKISHGSALINASIDMCI